MPTIIVGGKVSGTINASDRDLHVTVNHGSEGETVELIALRCEKCGGKLELKKAEIGATVVQTADGGYVVIAGSAEKTIKCMHCDTEYVPGKQLAAFDDGPTTIVTGDIVGSKGVAIGKNAKVVVIEHK